jgi:mycothiol synthase
MTGATAGVDVVERTFDPAADFPALVELICAVNDFDEIPWLPTIAQLHVDWAPAPGFEPAADLLVVDDGERLVGAGHHEWRERDGKIVHAIELWVHPEHRRRGLGRRLLQASEARARATAARGRGGTRDLPHVLSLSGATHLPFTNRFAEAAGYAPVRYHFVMRRDLAEEIPDALLPAGIEVRPVTEDQHRRIWEADCEAFEDHWEATVRTEADFVRMFANPDLDTSMWQVAWDGDQVAGSVQNAIYAEENARLGIDMGWLDHVSVRRPWRRRGVAGALISRSLRLLRDRGMAFAALGVDAESPTGAVGLYERSGFREHQRFVTFRKPL